MRFIDLSSRSPGSLSQVFLTLSIILFVYFIGGMGLLLDYSSFSGTSGGASEISDFTNILGNNRVLFWLLLPFVLAFIVFLLSIKWIHKRPILSVFTGRKVFDWKRVFTSFFLIIILLTILTCVQVVYSDTFQWNFRLDHFLVLLCLALLMIPIQTTIEELLFRGYLLQGLKNKLGSNKHAVILAGIVFGLIHYGNPEIEAIGNHVLLYYVASGVFLGCLALFDNGLELSIGYHAANNVFTALVVSNNWQVFQTDALFIDHAPPELSWWALLFLLSLFPFLLYIFKKIYKWKRLEEYWT
ncbi:MAG: type II CAAX endopeptidase family protein [Crocinitomicaceae bacterium]